MRRCCIFSDIRAPLSPDGKSGLRHLFLVGRSHWGDRCHSEPCKDLPDTKGMNATISKSNGSKATLVLPILPFYHTKGRWAELIQLSPFTANGFQPAWPREDIQSCSGSAPCCDIHLCLSSSSLCPPHAARCSFFAKGDHVQHLSFRRAHHYHRDTQWHWETQFSRDNDFQSLGRHLHCRRPHLHWSFCSLQNPFNIKPYILYNNRGGEPVHLK